MVGAEGAAEGLADVGRPERGRQLEDRREEERVGVRIGVGAVGERRGNGRVLGCC